MPNAPARRCRLWADARAAPGPPPDPQRPPFTPVPTGGDWLFLHDRAKRVDWWDRLKYIRLWHAENVYRSLGGEYRGEYERFDITAFGAGRQDTNGYYLERLLPHFDLHLGSHFRLFSEFQFDGVFRAQWWAAPWH